MSTEVELLSAVIETHEEFQSKVMGLLGVEQLSGVLPAIREMQLEIANLELASDEARKTIDRLCRHRRFTVEDRHHIVNIFGFQFKVIAGAPNDCVLFMHDGKCVGKIDFDLKAEPPDDGDDPV